MGQIAAVMPNSDFIQTMNRFGAIRRPFLFIIDFEMKKPEIFPLAEVNDNEILFNINGFTNNISYSCPRRKIKLQIRPAAFERFRTAFFEVKKQFILGNTFLLNLTFPSEIELNCDLKELYYLSEAKYKLYFRDEFVVFSPECFIRIKNGVISSFPMKGTIDAGLPGARQKLLDDEKEKAEHTTIVDLIRNDLSRAAADVGVKRFRYVEEIKTNHKNLLQASSEITGVLRPDYPEKIGDILFSLLPAGSISGAPKQKTLEIIKAVENYDRGYYTGVFGYFDGQNLDSGVMIRYIEKTKEGLFYKSGGGITIYSDLEKEYQELKDKIYVPVNRNDPGESGEVC
jgi:para-aminobenzoate synthetase component 1